MAAPFGNTNSLKTATRVHRLIVGTLPKKLVRVNRYVRQYRRSLEEVTAEQHGEVDVTAAHHIDCAVSHEQHSQICRWLLREKLETMATADIRECSKQLATAKDSRNRAVGLLELDTSHNMWDALDAKALPHVGDPPADATRDDNNASGCEDSGPQTHDTDEPRED